jgi:hypothetical protein
MNGHFHPLTWNVPHPTALIHQKEQGEPDQMRKHILMSEGSYSFVGEVPVRVCPPEGVRGNSIKGVSMRAFLNLKRTHEYRNLLPFGKQLSFYFLSSFSFGRKEIFPWEHWDI